VVTEEDTNVNAALCPLDKSIKQFVIPVKGPVEKVKFA
jgi:hypothetical protein